MASAEPSPVIHVDEIPPAVTEILTGTGPLHHERVYALLDPALARFESLDEDEQDQFREVLGRFVSLYGFIAQIVDFTDVAMERDYLYARMLGQRLPGTDLESIDIGSEVALTHLRIAQTSEGSASLGEGEGEGEVKAVFSGRGPQHDPDEEPLSQIIDALNERFGTELSEADQLLFDQYVETCSADPEIAAQVRNNTYDNFRLVFDRELLATISRRHDDNDELLKRVLDDDDFRGVLTGLIADEVYRRLGS